MKKQANHKQSNQERIKQQGETNPSPPTAQANEEKISRRQFFFFIVQTQIGVGILSLPYELHLKAKQDGWISLVIGAAILTIVLFVLWGIAKQFPEKDFFQINDVIFTKWPGRAISLFYVLYFMAVSVLIVLLFTRLISLWVLPNTPFWILAFLLIFVCLYLANAGLLIIARFYTMVSFLLLLLIVLTIYSLQEIHLMYLLPVGESGLGKIMSGVPEAMMSFLGFFVSLVFFSKVEGKSKDKLKIMLAAHLFVLVYYLFTVAVTYMFFSTEELRLVPEPLLYMLKSFELPIVARVDLFFVSIWVVSVATSFTTYIYMAGLGVKHIFNKKSSPIIHFILCLLIFVGATLIGYDMGKMNRFGEIIVGIGLGATVAFPFLMFPIVWLVKRMKGKGAGQA
ncbi:hypothetical protein EQV77_11735 [Halobacillus fulvus]|nr:hypothetical protein EQV77_11735 [Halobacillus fulvus]